MTELVVAAGLVCVAAAVLHGQVSEPRIRLEGVKIRVPDIEEAKRFYLGVLSFEVAKEDKRQRIVSLKTGGYNVVLEESREAVRISDAGYSDVSMSMRVNDIDETFKELKAAGVRFIKDEKRKEGIGWSLQILDPFGNKISMMQITAGKQETVKEPSVYNCGLYVTDIETALKTYRALGFTERSRAYMPEDMPLGTADGKFAFMLHLRRSDFPYVQNPNVNLVFRVVGVDARAFLKEKGVQSKRNQNGTFSVVDATGIESEVVSE